tara:strand:- start:14209 stop:14700 length:492 start_codon:yes stop_codon:yes gene_type:complete
MLTLTISFWIPGGVPEWSNGAVSKTVVRVRTEGSNPSPSAIVILDKYWSKMMTLKRYITEMGMGVDVHGKDYTNSAKRAVSDAIRHSSLNFFSALKKSPHDMKITVMLGTPQPDSVDKEAVAKELPYGKIHIKTVLGGLEIPNEDGNDSIVISNAAVLVYFDE